MRDMAEQNLWLKKMYAEMSERSDRRLVGTADRQQAQLGLQVVLFVSAQRAGLRLEPQARLPDLL